MSNIGAIIDLARQQITANEIAQRLGLHSTYVRRVARAHGIKLPRPPSDKIIDISGQTFGHLTAICSLPGVFKMAWLCRCSCGGEKIAPASALRAGNVVSCGCRYQTGDQCRTHGLSRTSEYFIWQAMKARCFNEKDAGFDGYGGRGITVCSRWIDSFEFFYADMGPRPSRKHSINRIDNDGNYEPSNCCWATQIEQMNNTRRQFFVWYGGEKMTVAQLHRRFSPAVSVGTLAARIRYGWDIDRALSAQVQWRKSA